MELRSIGLKRIFEEEENLSEVESQEATVQEKNIQ
jgi:hypothetical protein